MNVKMMNRLGRVLVCFLVICCILINCSPIKAKASYAAAYAVVAVAASVAVGCIAQGLGLLIQEGAEGFTTMVNDCTTFLEENGYTTAEGQVELILQSSEIENEIVWNSYVPESLVQAIRDWAFDTGVIDYDVAMEVTHTYTFNGSSYTVTGTAPWAPVVFLVDTSATGDMTFALVYVTLSKTVELGVSLFERNGFYSSSDRHRVKVDDIADLDTSCPIIMEDYVNASLSLVASSTSDIILSDVAPISVDLATGYPDWYGNALTLEDETSETLATTYYPVSIPSSTETVSMTQTEAQAGTISTELAESLTGALEETFDGTLATAPWQTFTQWLTTAIQNPIQAATEVIVTTIQSLVIPETDYITAKVEAIRAEFEFADAIITTGEFFKSCFEGLGTEPPIIYIDLGAAEGSYDIGDKVVFVDFSWYERYKPTGDILIASFLWIMFAWRMLMKIPSVIRGTAGAVSVVSAEKIGREGDTK